MRSIFTVSMNPTSKGMYKGRGLGVRSRTELYVALPAIVKAPPTRFRPMADLLRPTAGGRHRRRPGVHRPAGRLEDRGLQRRDPSKSRGPPPAPVSASVGRRAVGGPRRRPCPPCPRPRRLRPAASSDSLPCSKGQRHVHAVAACAGRGRGPTALITTRRPGPCGRQRNQPVWQLVDEGLESSAFVNSQLQDDREGGVAWSSAPVASPTDQASDPAERPGVRPAGVRGERGLGEPAGCRRRALESIFTTADVRSTCRRLRRPGPRSG